jgi:SAM-dependent methyltransferase
VSRLRHVLERRLRELAPGRRHRQELALEAIERFAAGRRLDVLDAGAEEGLLAIALGRRHPEWAIDAVDLNEDALARGRAWAAQEGVANVRYERRDLTKPVGDADYDAVAALECLLEIPDDEAAIASFARALRPGGLLVAHVPERSWKPVLSGSRTTWKREVRHGYAREEIAGKLERSGLEVERIRATTRATLQLGEEARERVRGASLKTRALAFPLLRAAVRLERAGLTWGAPRGFFVEARKRDEPVPRASA